MNARIALLLSPLFLFTAGTFSCEAAALQLVSATGMTNGTFVGVTFSGPLDAATAGNSAHYTLSGGLGISDAVVRSDGTSVSLTASGPVPSGTTLTVSGIKDSSGNLISGIMTVPVTLSGLTAQDIGNVVDTATVVPFANGEFDVLAGGRAIWSTEDSFNFIYEQRNGDFDVKVQLANYVSPDDQARAGLMMRESTDPGSKNVDLILYRPQRQLWGLTYRADDGGATTQPFAKGASATPPNAWLRMKRVGNDVRVYVGTNGFDWAQSFDLTVDFPASVLVGMATMATEGATTNRVAVDYRNYGDMVYSGAAINITSQPTNVTTTAGTTASFSVQAEAVNAPQSELTYQWQRNGTNIAGATGASYSTPVLTLGDQGATFRVLITLPGASTTSSQVTLQVTQDTTPPTVVAAYGLQGGNSATVVFSKPVDPSTATNTANYQVSGGLAIDSATLQNDSKTVALAISGGNLAANTTITVSGVKDVSGNVLAGNVTKSITFLPLTSVDIGDALPSTVTALGANDVQVLAGGRDIWGTDDSFNFVYQSRTNDFDVEVQVANFVPVSNNARASLMVRETLDTGSRNIDVILYPISRQLWGVTVRPDTSADTTQPLAQGAPTSLPDSWLRLRRNGSLFTMYYGKTGTNWLNSFTVTADYPGQVLVGMATTSNDNSSPDARIPVTYLNYRDFVYPNASVTITQQPVAVLVGAGKPATFAVGAQIAGAPAAEAVYQWQLNGTNIAGANGPSYTTGPLTLAQNGGRYRVIVSVPGAQVTSQEAGLTVSQDTTPPQALSALALNGASSIAVTFSEALDTNSASPANFQASGGLSVSDAVLSDDQKSIALTVSGVVPPSTTLTINNVKDLSGNPIVANTQLPVSILPLSVADVGAVNVPSKVVPLSATDFDVLAGGSDIWDVADAFNFVYEPKSGDFDVRVQVTKDGAVQGNARASLMVRETVDPGSKNLDLILYPVNRQLWGLTIRTNTDAATSQPMAAGAPVSFPNVWLRIQRQGSTFTSYFGTNGVNWPLSYPLTLDMSPNVLVGMATVSADNGPTGQMSVSYRHFGDVPLAAPTLAISRSNGQVVISWAGNATLQASDSVTGGWAPVPGATSPLTVTPTGQAKFYRLQQ